MVAPPGDRPQPRTSQTVDIGVLRRLSAVSADITLGRPLHKTLQAVADGVVEGLGFGVAAVNFVLPSGDLHIAAVAGPPSAHEALEGKIVPRRVVDDLLASSKAWGQLHYIPHSTPIDDAYSWVPPLEVPTDPDAWHPDDALLGPMYNPQGHLLGLISVDLPPGGRRPSSLLCELLSIFTAQAGIAIENARLLEEISRDRDRLEASETAFRFFFTGSAGAMCTINLDPADLGRVLQANDALGRLLGVRPGDLEGRHCFAVLLPEDRAENARAISEISPGGELHADRRLVRSDGSVIWAGLTGAAIVLDETRHPILLLHIDDITERKEREAKLAEMANADPLTGLPNRRALIEYLKSTLSSTERRSASGMVIYADLDGFKEINDDYGHSVGDLVLQEAAARLAGQFRARDVVARLGGDEFAVVAPGLDTRNAESLMERVRVSFKEPLPSHPAGIPISVSLGAAPIESFRSDSPARDAEALIHQADIAMYADKRAHRS